MNKGIRYLASALAAITATACGVGGELARTAEDTQPSISATPCQFDACGEGKPLEQGDAWLGSVLDSAGLEYSNEYRDDGGGGHLLTEWPMFISALRPESDPSAFAFSRGYTPYWDSDGTTVFGSNMKSRPGGGSSGAYFFWHAGGIDTWIEARWTSRITRPQDIRQVIDRIVAEQRRNEYP